MKGGCVGFQSLFCMFLRLSLCVCLLRYFLRFFLRCFLSSGVSLSVSSVHDLCAFLCTFLCAFLSAWRRVSLRFSLRFSLPFCFSQYISLHKEETEGESPGKFLSLCVAVLFGALLATATFFA